MPRFIRRDQDPEVQHDDQVDDKPNLDLVARMNAYAAPLTPDPTSPLSPRDQLMLGVTRPGRSAQPRRRARY